MLGSNELPGRNVAKQYKLWIHIEEIDYDDPEAETYKDLCESGEALPVPMATFDDKQKAIKYAESFADQGHDLDLRIELCPLCEKEDCEPECDAYEDGYI